MIIYSHNNKDDRHAKLKALRKHFNPEKMIWQNMNRLHHLQGRVLSVSQVQKDNDREYTHLMMAQGTSQQIRVKVPEEISRMHVSKFKASWQSRHSIINKYLNEFFWKVKDVDDHDPFGNRHLADKKPQFIVGVDGGKYSGTGAFPTDHLAGSDASTVLDSVPSDNGSTPTRNGLGSRAHSESVTFGGSTVGMSEDFGFSFEPFDYSDAFNEAPTPTSADSIFSWFTRNEGSTVNTDENSNSFSNYFTDESLEDVTDTDWTGWTLADVVVKRRIDIRARGSASMSESQNSKLSSEGKLRDLPSYSKWVSRKRSTVDATVLKTATSPANRIISTASTMSSNLMSENPSSVRKGGILSELFSVASEGSEGDHN